jgi:hypothetical protein
MCDASQKMTLIELARQKFAGDLLATEEVLFWAVEMGSVARFGVSSGANDIVRGDRLSWLCTDSNARQLVTHKGVSLVRAQIEGEVNLSFAKIPFPLAATECAFKADLFLRNSELAAFSLSGSSIRSLQAHSVSITGNVFLADGFTAERGVQPEDIWTVPTVTLAATAKIRLSMQTVQKLAATYSCAVASSAREVSIL